MEDSYSLQEQVDRMIEKHSEKSPESSSGLDKPFHVVTTENRFVAGYDVQEEALASAKDRNDKAEKLGIKTRYRIIIN